MPRRNAGQPIILLDLNFTLVENSDDPTRLLLIRANRYGTWIRQHETYRQWLVELLRPERIILATARETKHEAATLRRIKRLTRWQPDVACFNDEGLLPPAAKAEALLTEVFPRYGWPSEAKYLALESNRQTRAMYAGKGITAVPLVAGGEAANRQRITDLIQSMR